MQWWKIQETQKVRRVRACTEEGIAVEVASEGSGGDSVRVSMCVERAIGVCFVSGFLAATGVIVWKTCGSSRSDSRPSRPDYSGVAVDC